MIVEIKTLPRKRVGARGKPPTVVVIKCDICGDIFERAGKYRTAYEKAKIHRCSKACTYGHRKSDGLGGHGADIIVSSCTECGEKLTRWKSQTQENKVYGDFCNMSCWGAWRSKNPESYAIWYEKSTTPEAHKNISKTICRKQKEGTYVHPFQGKHHSSETKKRISEQHLLVNHAKGKNNPMHGIHHTDAAKEIMSLKRVEMILSGKVKSYGKNRIAGDYVSLKTGEKMYYRSSWELAIMKFLDDNDDVVSYGYENIKIPYYYKNQKRWYVPDFLVDFKNETRQIWEVKPSMFIKAEKTQQKAAASREYCVQENIDEYRFITEIDLRALEIMPSYKV